MLDRKLSVDDILDEIRSKQAGMDSSTSSGDLRRVDDIIREIVTQRQEKELNRDPQSLTEQEKAELKKEIEEQTKSLTQEFAKRTKESELPQQELPAEEDLLSEGEPLSKAEPVSHSSSPKAPPSMDHTEGTRPILLPPGLEKRSADEEPLSEEAEMARQKLEHTQKDMHVHLESITGHFGNFKMEDVHVEDVYLKSEITPSNYREYKNNRNRKIADFTLDASRKKKEEVAEEATAEASANEDTVVLPGVDSANELAEAQWAAEQKLRSPSADYSYEYTSVDQTEAVLEQLRSNKHSLRTKLMWLGAIALNALWLAFSPIRDGAVYLFGGLAIAPMVYAAVNLALLLLSLILSGTMFRNAMESLTARRPTKDCFVLATALVCGIVNLVFLIWPSGLLTKGAHLFTPLAVLILFLGFTAKYQTAARALDNFKFVSGEQEKFAVTPVHEVTAAKQMTKGVLKNEPILVKNTKANFLQNFLSHSFSRDVSDRVMYSALLVVLPLSVVLGVVGFFLTKNIFSALSLWSGAMVLGCGFLGTVVVSFPLQDTLDVLRHFSGMMTGYDAVEEYKDVNAILVDGCDLFPGKSVVLHSIKAFQGKRVDDAILDAASLSIAANSALKSVFYGAIGECTDILRPVDSVQYEDLMGLSAWVADRRVLLGNRELMVHHSIAVPKQEYEDQYREEGGNVVYLAAEGALCAAFILEFKAAPEVTDAVRLLRKNHMAAVVRTVDSIITVDFLTELFGADSAQFKILPSYLHAECEEQLAPRERQEAMMGNDGSLFGYIVSLVAVKKLYYCIFLGKVLYLGSTAFGIFLLTLLTILGKAAVFGPIPVLLFLGVFLLGYWLYEKNMRL